MKFLGNHQCCTSCNILDAIPTDVLVAIPVDVLIGVPADVLVAIPVQVLVVIPVHVNFTILLDAIPLDAIPVIVKLLDAIPMSV